jgi:predicted membrane protein
VVVTGPSDDPVLRRRAQIARLADLGQKVGYGLFGVAVVAFVVAAVVGFSPAWVTVIVVAMVVGSIVLAPAIVLGFAAKAADREDREVGR